jgi:hypothetical protein
VPSSSGAPLSLWCFLSIAKAVGFIVDDATGAEYMPVMPMSSIKPATPKNALLVSTPFCQLGAGPSSLSRPLSIESSDAASFSVSSLLGIASSLGFVLALPERGGALPKASSRS